MLKGIRRRPFYPANCHPDLPRVAKGLCRPCYRKQYIRPFKAARCGHPGGAWAKGLCGACYDKEKLRKPRITPATCGHDDRIAVAFGLCQKCYYHRYKATPGKQQKMNTYARKWRAENPERASVISRSHRQRHLEKRRELERASTRKRYAQNRDLWKIAVWEDKLRRKYGMSVPAFNTMLADQGGGCAICRTTNPAEGSTLFKRFHVDHDHDSSRVRGLLCHACNMALGLFRHDAEVLLAAARYLRTPPPFQAHYRAPQVDYDRLLAHQGGRCAICGTTNPRKRDGVRFTFEQDHDRKTGLVRGLLCGHCNKAIGKFREDMIRLQQAAAYLCR